MADEIDLAAMIVEMRADIKQMKSELKEGEKDVQDTADTMTKTFKKAAAEIAKAFTLKEIFNFVKDSLKEFAEIEKAVNKLGKVVNGTGGDWKKLKSEALAFTEQMKETTKFQDEELVDVLGKVTFKVKDLGVAMGITRMATKLSSLTGQELAESSDMLALAYQGNSRGLMQLAKSLGVAGEKAQDVGFLFAELEKRTAASSGEVETLATGWNRFTKGLKDLKEDVGTALAPAARWILSMANEWLPKAWQAVKGLGIAWTGIFLDIGSWIEKMKTEFGLLVDFVAKAWKHPLDAYREYKAGLKAADDQYQRDLKANAEVTQAEFDKIYTHEEQKFNETSAAKLAAQAKHNKEMLDAEKFDWETFFSEQLALQVKSQQMRRKNEEKLFEDFLKMREKDLEDAKKSAEEIVKTSQKVAENLVNAFREGKDAAQAFARFMYKSAVDALAGILEQMGKSYVIQGLVEEAATYGASGAQKVVGGGLLAAAAGAMKAASTAYLAEGGIVTGPTKAVIGEGGEPEAVVPLSKAGSMGFGGEMKVTQHIGINLPNVRRPEDFTTPEARRTIGRILSEELQNLQDRKGLRGQSGIA